MEYIQIDKIIVEDNVRKDYGDLTELTASIKEHGVRKPLELNSLHQLVDGFRRLRAAKAAGLTEVPYFYNSNTIDNTTEQILSGIFSKNLNAVEEGHAFVKYMKENKVTTKDLAKRLSKTEGYIQKRIEIVTLPKEITDEIISKRLEIGHALLLKKMPEPEAKKFMKDIIREGWNVAESKNRAQYDGQELNRAKFDKEQCKGCKFNGSEQSELFETGKILNGKCMNPGCYMKKTQELIKQLKEKYKDVLYTGDKYTPDGYVDAEYEWDLKNAGIDKAYMTQCRKEKLNYLVKITVDGEVKEYFKKPTKKEKFKAETKAGNAEGNVKQEPRNTNSLQEFKTNFLIEKSKELMEPGSKNAKVLAIVQILSRLNYNEMDLVKKDLNTVIPGYGDYAVPKVSKILEAREPALDKALMILSSSAYRRLGAKGLIEFTENVGVDLKKHFVITEDFLKIHTKDQLLQMIKDLGIKTAQEYDDVKKDDLIKYILDKKEQTKGKVPKTLI